jgi:PAS domain S-box-containing protein
MSTERERFLNALLESAVDYAIISTDLDGLVTSWNAGAENLLGWSEAEMIGQPAARFFTDEDRRAGIPQAEMTAALTKGRGSDERWHLRKDGEVFWANGEMLPLRDEAGTVQGFIKILRDRTAQRLAAEANRADAEFLRGVLASTADCIKVMDLEGRLTFISENGQKALQIEDFTTVKGCPWPDFWQGDGKTAVHTALASARAGGIGHFQSDADTFKGVTKTWDVQVTPIFGPDGRPENILAVSRDITVMRESERAQKRADRHRAALADLTDHLRDLNDIGEMSYAAARVAGEVLGVTRAGYATARSGGEEVVIDRDWTAPGVASIAGLHKMRSYGSFIDNLRAGETVLLEDVSADPRTQGHTAQIEALAIGALINMPLLEHGRLVAIFFVHSPTVRVWTKAEQNFIRNLLDRTRNAIERRRAEENLQALADSLESQVAERTAERDRIWHVSHDMLVVADPDGVLLSVNPAWTHVLGWAHEDIVGRAADWLIHPDDVARTHEELGRIMAGQASGPFENRFRAQDGSYRDMSWTTTPVDGLMYAAGRDVTEQKSREAALAKAEEALRQSQKMEALGQLTGGIAHDFNNLLTGIIGALDIMRRRIASNRPGDLTRFMDGASASAQRAAALTHRLLAFARRQSLDTKPSDINRLVSGMEELLHRTLGEQVSLRTILDPETWPAMTDDNQLENAILNLGLNARDAMPGGGMLTIETGNTRLDESYARLNDDVKPGEYVVISVTDTGAGMPPDVVAKAFDPFFTTKPIGEGTGLGLSMIYGFVKQCAGHVRIYSEVGVGSSIKLFLPRAVSHAEADDSEAADVPLGRGETVLVVEDDPTVRLLMVDVLEELGYRHLEAPDGNAAIPILRSRQRIDLLLTDVGLPNMNGRQLAEIARGVRPGLRVLFVTGYAEKAAVRHEFLEPGMEMLTKPFALDALAMKVREMIER